MEYTNDLRHTIETTSKNGDQMRIKIRLNDECKNGHEDFAITATIWQKGKPRTDRYFISGGCQHDEILSVHPELKIFVDLHMCDWKGNPLNATANGLYHLKKDHTAGQEYLRITHDELQTILYSGIADEMHLGYLLTSLGITDRWGYEAAEATRQLEQMTGKRFESKATRDQLGYTPEQHEHTTRLVEKGYYSRENVAARKAHNDLYKKNREIANLKRKRDEAIEKADNEYNVCMAILAAGLSLDNFIYYSHTNTGQFNWLSYKEEVTAEEFEGFLQFIKEAKNDYVEALPKGIVFSFQKK